MFLFYTRFLLCSEDIKKKVNIENYFGLHKADELMLHGIQKIAPVTDTFTFKRAIFKENY